MRKITVFLALAFVALTLLVAVVIAGYYVLSRPTAQTPYPSNWMSQMWQGMGGMMNGNWGTATTTQDSAAPIFGIAFIVLVVVAVIGLGGLGYFILLPEIRVSRPMRPSSQGNPTIPNNVSSPAPIIQKTNETLIASPYESVLKTLTGNERKVVEVLRSHQGKYLQKYIRSEAKLSRLQTHRVVARLAERGIVELEKTGNTNMVMMANWLQ